MQVEALTTFLDLSEWRETIMGGELPSLLGVFQDLPYVPSGFFLHARLRLERPRAALLQTRLLWRGELQYELIPEVHDFLSRRESLIIGLNGLRLGSGNWTVQLTSDNSLLAETMIHFSGNGDVGDG